MSTILLENQVSKLQEAPITSTSPANVTYDEEKDAPEISTTLENNSTSSGRKELGSINSNTFTFKPKLNPKSQVLAKNILDFYERQNLHSKKQLEILEEAYKMSTNDYGKLLYSTTYSSNDPNNFFNSSQFQPKVRIKNNVSLLFFTCYKTKNIQTTNRR
jgi:hypothetical protein